MYDHDEPPLEGEYLRAICIALNRNGISGLKGAAVVLDPEGFTSSPEPPKSDSPNQSSPAVKEAEHAFA